MIVTRLCGGLGNQMFQYAAGVALAAARHTTLKLDLAWFETASPLKPHERYALSSFSLEGQVASAAEIDLARGVPRTKIEIACDHAARTLRLHSLLRRLLHRGHVHFDGDFSYHPSFFAQSANTYLHGNWQSEKFFLPAAPRVRAEFRFRTPPPPGIAALAERIQRSPAAFMHVRRGDYVSDPRYAREIGALPPDYYLRAAHLLRTKHPAAVIYVFSDDIDAATRELTPPGPCEFVREPPGTAAHEVLRLMCLCEHAIIANSTLSWWAAWLNPKPDKFVAAPEPWFVGTGRNGADIVPGSWTLVPRRA